MISWLNPKLRFLFYSALFNGTGADGVNFMWDDICVKMPVTNADCNSSPEMICYEDTIFDIWSDCGKRNKIAPALEKLTDRSAVKAVINGALVKSGISGKDLDMDKYLGGLTKDDDGNIIKATAIKFLLLNEIKDEFPAEDHELWEKKFLELTLGLTLPSNLELYPMAPLSIKDVIGDTIDCDAYLLSIGVVIVFLYNIVMIGK
jgi:hypothetical protein